MMVMWFMLSSMLLFAIVVLSVLLFSPFKEYPGISVEAMSRILAGFGTFRLRNSTTQGWYFLIPVENRESEGSEWLSVPVSRLRWTSGSIVSREQYRALQAAAREEFSRRIAPQ